MFTDGPVLPIEFSRVSMDGRLTLVIDAKVCWEDKRCDTNRNTEWEGAKNLVCCS